MALSLEQYKKFNEYCIMSNWTQNRTRNAKNQVFGCC